jgi:WD40 repeat protein
VDQHAKRVAISPDGNYVAVATAEGTVVWDWAGREVTRAGGGGNDKVRSILFQPDSPRVLTWTLNPSNQDIIQIWDLITGREVAEKREGGVVSVAFGVRGTIALATILPGLGRGQVEVLGSDLTVAPTPFLPIDRPGSVAVSDDGRRIVVATPTHLTFWDSMTGNKLLDLDVVGEPRTRASLGYPTDLAFSVDGQRLLASSGGRSVIIFDAAVQRR